MSCTSEIKKNRDVFVIATYDDVTDWDPATAYSLEVRTIALDGCFWRGA